MSKRQRDKFERRERDFYPTPLKSVLPLVPYLRADGVKAFAEPCVGEGHIVRHLESMGFRCTYQGDIATGQDALGVNRFEDPPITNPPYDRNRVLLFALIDHFLRTAPFCWLLLKADFAHLKSARRFLVHCTNIVSAGREAHMGEGQGFENCAWFRFDPNHKAGPVMGPAGGRRAMLCIVCGGAFTPTRADAKTCQSKCRQALYRSRLAVTQAQRLAAE